MNRGSIYFVLSVLIAFSSSAYSADIEIMQPNGRCKKYSTIDDAWKHLSNGGTLLLPEGLFIFSAPVVDKRNMQNITIKGAGYKKTILKAFAKSPGTNRPVFYFNRSSNLVLEDVTLWAVAEQAYYSGGHAYGTVLNSTGSARSCCFVFENRLHQIDQGRSAKCIVNLFKQNRFSFKQCVIAQFDTSVYVPSYFGAHHDDGDKVTSYTDCIFIGKNTSFKMMGRPQLTGTTFCCDFHGDSRGTVKNVSGVKTLPFPRVLTWLPDVIREQASIY